MPKATYFDMIRPDTRLKITAVKDNETVWLFIGTGKEWKKRKDWAAILWIIWEYESKGYKIVKELMPDIAAAKGKP